MSAEILHLPAARGTGAGSIILHFERGAWSILHQSGQLDRRFPLASFTVERFARVAAQAIASELGTGVFIEGECA